MITDNVEIDKTIEVCRMATNDSQIPENPQPEVSDKMVPVATFSGRGGQTIVRKSNDLIQKPCIA